MGEQMLLYQMASSDDVSYQNEVLSLKTVVKWALGTS